MNEPESIEIIKEDAPPATENSDEVPAVIDSIIAEADDIITAEPEIEPEPEIEYYGEPDDTAPTADEHFFDGAVFVGDSVTLGLRNYVTSERNEGRECLGNAVFLPEGSMGYTNTIREIGDENSIHPRYEGEEMYIEDALALIKAEKVFIMLGMNDFCIYSTEAAMGNVEECINRIKEKNPEINIYIESVTPVNRDRGDFSNANIDIFNAALKKLCIEIGCTYVDIASVMKDSDGALIEAYCSDPDGMGIHMTYEGCNVWVDYLYTLFGMEKRT